MYVLLIVVCPICTLFFFLFFGNCVVCSSSIHGFWLPLWYLQTLLVIIQIFRMVNCLLLLAIWQLYWGSCYSIFGFICMFCRLLFVPYCSSFFCPSSIYGLLITTLVFSNSSITIPVLLIYDNPHISILHTT